MSSSIVTHVEMGGPVPPVRSDAEVLPTNVKDINQDSEAPIEASSKVIYSASHMQAWKRRLVMLSLCMALLLAALDVTILSTALPTIASNLQVTSTQYAWVNSSFTLTSTAATPVWAKMSDILGRKSCILASIVIFMAGSLVCALANASAMLIGGRAVQGLGAGGTLVLVTIVIGDIFPLAERAKYYGLTGLVWGLSSAVGPVLGGVFTQTANWRWCFYINLPFDGLAVLALTFLLTVKIETEPLREGLRNLDWVGFVFIIGGTICFLLGLEFGPAGLKPWVSATTICLIVFGLLLLALFATWEAKIASNPIIPGRVFNSGTNAATFAVSCTHAFVFVSFDFFLPLYFQVILGMTPLISGVTIFALVLSSAITTMSGGFITRRTGNYKVLMIAGSCMMLLGGGLFINFDLEKQWPKIIIYQAIAGCGAGLLFQAPMIALQSHLKQKDLAAGMSAMNFLRSLVVSVSTVIGTIIMDQAVSSNSLTSLNDEAGERSDRKRYISGLHTLWAFYAGVSSIMLIGSFFVKQLPREKPSSASDKGISETPPLEKNNE